MDYNPLSLYLEKFKKILNKDSVQKEEIINTIFNEVGYKVSVNNIKIKNAIVYFQKISPILKNEIFIHKEKILRKLKELNLNIIDIK